VVLEEISRPGIWLGLHESPRRRVARLALFFEAAKFSKPGTDTMGMQTKQKSLPRLLLAAAFLSGAALAGALLSSSVAAQHRKSDRSEPVVATWSKSWRRATAAVSKKDGPVAAVAFNDAVRVNIRQPLRAKLAPIVAAIRFAENGGPGREYGILHARVKPTYRSQAGWCAATVQKNYDRWQRAGSRGSFVEFLGNRYCPVGAENDPTGLNRHWVKNVTKLVERMKR
jgi:hypothetical protein